ncbi:apolipoprotein N-acyltransferase [Undibacterium parvum]|uniref:Apolipoprotein N-acyltransferase n=1 Tax=Undibacterium parvum TaxID=401471 RepID=A0A3Q9BS85_9BURK|nr:apolipoprotein N-acyltransferase [Undibacterium parvum]AZP13304.1 apolipoprotein N-acyltransferase [Undibacterium parvum]
MTLLSNSKIRRSTIALVGILASALLAALYVRGGAAYLLGFVMLVPWLRTLDARSSIWTSLLSGYAMSLAYTAAAFAWFGSAIGSYTQVGAGTGLALLLLAAPLFQPQFLVFALVRHVASYRYGVRLRTLAAAAAWLATEYLVPRLLGDTLGYGLYPSPLMRQAADLGGTAGLTFLLLLANEGVALALARRTLGWRVFAKPLAMSALVPALLTAYGMTVLTLVPALSPQPTVSEKPLRMGLIQANLTDYEGLRQAKGAHAVVREVLDTHFAMSYDAVVRQGADAVLWSETAYPTTFGHPKSEAGAEFDQEILATIKAAGVPFVFGTYDSDTQGEYNAAAFVQPDHGLLGFYRKTRLFPLTEYVPAWLESENLRRLLPWTGNWRAGNGARVFPLRLTDGRDIPVLPLICLDDVDTGLAIHGARLGARAILTMSNDSWFSSQPLGAQLHQAAAAFRSIETRLPQFRVTSNGYSAVIDAYGNALAGSRMGERSLVIAALPVTTPARTLMVWWGDWVGLVASVFLLMLAAQPILALIPGWRLGDAAAEQPLRLPVRVALLPPAARYAAALLRAFARASLLWMCAAMLFNEALRTNTLAQIRTFGALFLAPEAASWSLLLAYSARASLENGSLVLSRGAQRFELAISEISALVVWRLPLPCPGASLRLVSGQRWRYALALANPPALARALAAAGGPPLLPCPPSPLSSYAQARLAMQRWRLDHPLVKFALLPLALAIPAFHLHQHIAYGSAFGEYYSFGLKAYLIAFALWWSAWSIGVVLSATLLRASIEIGTLITALLSPGKTIAMRRWLERIAHVMLYLGLPSWLLFNVYAA